MGGALLGGLFVAPAIAATGVYGLSKYLAQAKASNDPAQVRVALESAMAQLAQSRHEITAAVEALEQEIESWSKTAKEALRRDREDLARAALMRQYPLKKRLKQQQQQLSEIQVLERPILSQLPSDR